MESVFFGKSFVQTLLVKLLSSNPKVFCIGEKKVCFKEIFDHLNTVHKNTWFEINGESNKWTELIKMNGFLKDGRKWAPSKMTSTNGDVFSLVARVHK